MLLIDLSCHQDIVFLQKIYSCFDFEFEKYEVLLVWVCFKIFLTMSKRMNRILCNLKNLKNMNLYRNLQNFNLRAGLSSKLKRLKNPIFETSFEPASSRHFSNAALSGSCGTSTYFHKSYKENDKLWNRDEFWDDSIRKNAFFDFHNMSTGDHKTMNKKSEISHNW